MTNEPSPRPWRVEKNVVGWNSFIMDANGDGVAACWRTARVDGEKERQYNEANAELIVDAVNERDRLRDLVRRLTEYADAITGYRPRTVEVLSSEHPAWTFDGAALLREARAAIGEDKP